jgi:alkanesulfonate monooxygenase SsuD/methylene tetrahydromethanopterin reductase-like flavin-dependent oxidoreductase (luciferase family)
MQLYEESLEVILRAWTASERWSHSGRLWKFDNVLVEPETVQSPRPPVWVGAASEPSIVRAADMGFKLLLDQIGSFEKTGERINTYLDRMTELGREASPYDIAVTRSVHIVESAAERARAIKARGAMMEKLAALANSGAAPKNAMAAAFSSDITEATELGSIIGDVEECIERLERLREEGVEYVLLVDPANDRETLDIFATEIIPRVRPRVTAREK